MTVTYGGTGFWHEAYFIAGGAEAVYDDLGTPTGLGPRRASRLRALNPASGSTATATANGSRERCGRSCGVRLALPRRSPAARLVRTVRRVILCTVLRPLVTSLLCLAVYNRLNDLT